MPYKNMSYLIKTCKAKGVKQQQVKYWGRPVKALGTHGIYQ